MKPIPSKAVASFLCKVADTRESECDCVECARHLGELVERQIAGGKSEGDLARVAHHLDMCQECREEFQALETIVRRDPTDTD